MNFFKTILSVAIFAMAISSGVFAQNPPKILAVVNSASWCSVCKANGERAMGAFMENNKSGEIQFVMNDVSNAETSKKSAAELTKLGLTKAMLPYKASGVVYFFDAKTKEPLTQITVANSNEEIAMVVRMVLKGK
jgi:thiol:disulfide interchange protein